MDAYEARRVVFSRIQALDPENAAKIMGLLLIQDHGADNEMMIRLAFGPEALLRSLVLTARNDLGLGPFHLSRHNSSRLLSPSSPPPPPSPFYVGDLVDGLHPHEQLSDLFYPEAAGDCRSLSVADLCLGSENAGSGFGWKPCLYFAKGFCKNGSGCRFLHDDSAMTAGGEMDAMVEQELLLRSQSQRLCGGASQFMASAAAAAAAFPYSPTASSTNKCVNLLLQHHLQQNDRQRAAALMLAGDEAHKFAGMVNPGSRQIYLTFPADSTFREEDVSNYFSIYGPVQDVRIPYQQKRMFGFVTFLYPETVKLILAKGNPHFVCDARVLVKPYKEKGKVPDRYRNPYDLQQFGGRMMHSSSCKDMLLRRREMEEQQHAAELQEAIELQRRQFMGIQLLHLKKQSLTSLTADQMNNSSSTSSSSSSSPGGKSPSPAAAPAAAAAIALPFLQAAERPVGNGSPHGLLHGQVQVNGSATDKEESNGAEDGGFQESAEHNLPDSPFASPTRDSPFSSAAPVTGALRSGSPRVMERWETDSWPPLLI